MGVSFAPKIVSHAIFAVAWCTSYEQAQKLNAALSNMAISIPLLTQFASRQRLRALRRPATIQLSFGLAQFNSEGSEPDMRYFVSRALQRWVLADFFVGIGAWVNWKEDYGKASVILLLIRSF